MYPIPLVIAPLEEFGGAENDQLTLRSMNRAALSYVMPHRIGGKLLEPCEPYISLRAWREHFEDIRAQLLKHIMIVHGAIFARSARPVDSTNRVRSQRNAGN